MNTFDLMHKQIVENVRYANRFKNTLRLTSCVCIITDVNAKNFTVDVTIPSNNSKLFNVQIATNITGGNVSMHMLPTKGQKGVVLLSTQHAPLLIATIANKKQGYNDSILENEAFVGTPLSFLKIGNDESALLKTPYSCISLSDDKINMLSKSHITSSSNYRVECGTNENTGGGFSVETFYSDKEFGKVIKKEEVIIEDKLNNEIKADVLNDNNRLTSKMQLMIDELDKFSQDAELGNAKTIDKLKDLKKLFCEQFIKSDSRDAMIVEKGDSYYNIDNGYVYSVRKKTKIGCDVLFAISNDGTVIQK